MSACVIYLGTLRKLMSLLTMTSFGTPDRALWHHQPPDCVLGESCDFIERPESSKWVTHLIMIKLLDIEPVSGLIKRSSILPLSPS